jgi:hypothetical protein
MREIRQSGSEGGGSRTQSVLPTPIVEWGWGAAEGSFRSGGNVAGSVCCCVIRGPDS